MSTGDGRQNAEGERRETEVKFFVSDLKKIESRLRQSGAQVVQPRTHEYNLRFDNAESELTRAAKVLRLRRDTAVRLTYKGPGKIIAGVQERDEFEFKVDDFDGARKFIEALGYSVSMIYEKYRTIYRIHDDVLVTLDEMPYGEFVEVEGPDAPSILGTARQLGLDLNTRILTSYAAVFEALRQRFHLSFRDLTFENFTSTHITAGDLGLKTAA
jgi:adenylate cyclase class 2